MDIAQYIADLLNENDEVSILGAGTFYKIRTPASFAQNSNIFFPPKKQLSYRPAPADEGALLVAYISQTRNISLSAAQYFAEQFGETLQSALTTNGVFDIFPLGHLKMNSGQYSFTPREVNDNKEFYGLKPIKDFGKSVLKKPAIQTENNIEEETTRRSAWPIILIIFILIVALGAIGYLNYPDLFQNITQSSQTDSQPKKTIPIVTPKPDSVIRVDSIPAEKMLDSTTTKNTEITPVQGSTYEIIGASLRNVAEAEKYLAEMKAKGLNAKIIDDNGKRVKVSLGTFTDRGQAEAEQRRIQAEMNPDAWILEIKD